MCDLAAWPLSFDVLQDLERECCVDGVFGDGVAFGSNVYLVPSLVNSMGAGVLLGSPERVRRCDRRPQAKPSAELSISLYDRQLGNRLL